MKKIIFMLIFFSILIFSYSLVYASEKIEVIGFHTNILDKDSIVQDFNSVSLKSMAENYTMYKYIKNGNSIHLITANKEYIDDELYDYPYPVANVSFEIDDEFFNFFTEENLKNLLKNNDINYHVEDVFLIDQNPFMLCIITDKENYIMIAGMEGFKDDYKIYTSNECKEIFSLRYANIFNNGLHLDRDYKPFINTAGYSLIPLRCLLDTVTDKVEWDEQNKKIYFKINDDNYVMYIDGNYLRTYQNGESWSAYAYYIIDDYIYLSSIEIYLRMGRHFNVRIQSNSKKNEIYLDKL